MWKMPEREIEVYESQSFYIRRVGLFEKVRYEQFLSDMGDEREASRAYGSIRIPVRSTTGSAGYDFVSPISFSLPPASSFSVWTGVKVKIEEGWFLFCVPRSSLGCKYGISLANTCAVIDSDYYNNPDNEGHIMFKLINNSDTPVAIRAGDRIVQGIFLPFGVTFDDNVTADRTGGFGSTGK